MVDLWDIDRLWRFYRLIEKDLVTADTYVEPGQNKVYSVFFKKIILVSGVFIEETLKKLCAILSPEEKTGDINDYKKIICTKIPAICNIEIYVKSWEYRTVKPFSDWSEGKKLPIWDAYNTIKHDPDNIEKANFGLAVNMVGALYILLLYIERLSDYGVSDTSSEYFYSEYGQEDAPKVQVKELPII